MNSYNDSSNSEIENQEELKPYYVYALFDKSNNKIFYIGKGHGKRCTDHEKDAFRSGAETEKLEKIRQLKKTDSFGVMVISRHDSEAVALAVEAVLIKWAHGKDNLTNIKHGINSDYIRNFENFSPNQQGLDIEDSPEKNGEFSKIKIEALKEHRMYEYRDEFISLVKSCGFRTDNFKNKFKSFDPIEGNGYLGFVVSINDIDLIVEFTKTKKISIKILATSNFSQSFEFKLLKIGYSYTEIRNRGQYARILKGGEEIEKFTTPEDALRFLEMFQSLMRHEEAA